MDPFFLYLVLLRERLSTHSSEGRLVFTTNDRLSISSQELILDENRPIYGSDTVNK